MTITNGTVRRGCCTKRLVHLIVNRFTTTLLRCPADRSTLRPVRPPLSCHLVKSEASDGKADPSAGHLHGALLSRPVHPAQQHPGSESALTGHQLGQPYGDPGRANAA